MTLLRPRPTADDVRAAARRIAPFVTRTPCVHSAWLTAHCGADVWLKLETVQTTGSFKFRGAINAIARLRAERPGVNAVITGSAGNHGLALAAAGARLGGRVRVHLPATAPETKRTGIAAAGAEMVFAQSYDAAEAAAQDEARRTGLFYVSPYDDADVIAGAGTVGEEIFADVQGLDAVIVPVGGGGLISGIAIAAGRTGGVEVHGAEATASPVFTAALAAGKPVTVTVHPTLAQGLAGNMDPASMTFGIVRDLVGRVVAVDEASIGRAMRDLAYRDGVVAEGAGATRVAALAGGALDLAGRRVAVVISGRNVDEAVLRRVLQAG